MVSLPPPTYRPCSWSLSPMWSQCVSQGTRRGPVSSQTLEPEHHPPLPLSWTQQGLPQRVGASSRVLSAIGRLLSLGPQLEPLLSAQKQGLLVHSATDGDTLPTPPPRLLRARRPGRLRDRATWASQPHRQRAPHTGRNKPAPLSALWHVRPQNMSHRYCHLVTDS